MRSRRGEVIAIACFVIACRADDGASTSFGSGSIGSAGDSGETSSGETSSGGVGSDAPDATSGDIDTSSGGSVGTGVCSLLADGYGGALLELDVGPDSDERLRFTIRDVPAELTSATLRFASEDCDHPGEEGTVVVNGNAPHDLPAMATWDNAAGDGALEVLGELAVGDNTIEFGPGPLERSFFRIGNVALDVELVADACPDGPDAIAVERTVDYHDATYTMRHNWVLRCDDYAYTAHGADHAGEDCDGLFAPDGTSKGTATFAFDELVPASYEVQIRSRHTVNRNPAGALFIVDGVEKRIPQNDDLDYVTDVWGTADLGGDVVVVLDSTREDDESDSVIWVRLVPTG